MRKKGSLQRSPWPMVAVFLLPSFIGFLVFLAIPMFATVGISMTNFSGGPRYDFIGFANYINAFRSVAFRNTLLTTFNFTFWTVILQLSLGLAFAMLLNKKMFGRNFSRGVMFLPNVLSSVAVALVFSLIFDPRQGPVNQYLLALGLPAPEWLAGLHSALPTIIMITVWQSFGYYMVLFLGGLQTISSSLYEAADIDGAGPVRRFLSITLPGLSPIIFFAVTIAIIRGFQVFDLIFVMTGGQHGGGPAGATTVMVFSIYRNAFSQFRFGFAAAESVVLLAVVLLVTIIQQRGQKRWVSYDVV